MSRDRPFEQPWSRVDTSSNASTVHLSCQKKLLLASKGASGEVCQMGGDTLSCWPTYLLLARIS